MRPTIIALLTMLMASAAHAKVIMKAGLWTAYYEQTSDFTSCTMVQDNSNSTGYFSVQRSPSSGDLFVVLADKNWKLPSNYKAGGEIRFRSGNNVSGHYFFGWGNMRGRSWAAIGQIEKGIGGGQGAITVDPETFLGDFAHYETMTVSIGNDNLEVSLKGSSKVSIAFQECAGTVQSSEIAASDSVAGRLPFADGTYALKAEYCGKELSGTMPENSFYELKGEQVSNYETFCAIRDVSVQGEAIKFKQVCESEGETSVDRVTWKKLSATSFSDKDGHVWVGCGRFVE